MAKYRAPYITSYVLYSIGYSSMWSYLAPPTMLNHKEMVDPQLTYILADC